MLPHQISAAPASAGVAQEQLAGATLRARALLNKSRASGQSSLLSTAIWSILLAQRSVRAVSAEIARRALLGAGWLLATATHPQLLRFGRRWFKVRRWHVLAGALLGVKALQLAWRLAASLLRAPARWELEQRMKQAASYEEWSALARELDRLKSSSGRQRGAATLPDEWCLRQRQARLRGLRQQGDVAGLMYELRVDLARHASSVKDSTAAEHCPLSELRPLHEYLEEVKEALGYVAGCTGVPLEERLSFFREIRHAYGRTALCLSGGASFGYFHFGVWQVLLNANLLPRVLTGSSAGSIAAATVCTRTDEELHEAVSALPATIEEASRTLFFSHDTHLSQLRHMFKAGVLHDAEWFHQTLRGLYGDLTFAEAYQKTGRVLNISVSAQDSTTSEPYRLLNYLTAPHVLVRSGVAASCSFPLFFHAQELLAKDAHGNIRSLNVEGASQLRRWIDGSIQADLPMRGISEMFNVNFFVTSQCNPHLIPLVAIRRALPPTIGRLWELELKHRCTQLLRFFPRSHLLSFLRQPWEGDISIVLPHGVLPFIRASFNLTQQELYTAMQEGRVATWAKMAAIESSCAIEVAIDSSLQQLTAAAQAQRAQQDQQQQLAVALRRSLPSWLHMPGQGQSRPMSRDPSANFGPAQANGRILTVLPETPSPREAMPAAAAAAAAAVQGQQEGGEGAEGGLVLAPPAAGAAAAGQEAARPEVAPAAEGGSRASLDQEGATAAAAAGPAAPLGELALARGRQEGREGGSGRSTSMGQAWEARPRAGSAASGSAASLQLGAAAAPPPPAEPGLERGSVMWRDLALLGGIASAGDYGLDVIAI